MDLKQLWDTYFPDLPNCELIWFEKYNTELIRQALEIAHHKDKLHRFDNRDARNVGRYVTGILKKLSTKVGTVTIDLIFEYTITAEDIRRFDSKIERCGDCLIYTAGNGVYGRFHCGERSYGAHVFAYFADKYNQLPLPNELRGLHIAHSCNQPRCCNPAHLRLTTQAVNLLERDLLSVGVSNTHIEHPAIGEQQANPAIEKGVREGIEATFKSPFNGLEHGLLTSYKTAFKNLIDPLEDEFTVVV